jgi:hypothetical protein
MKLLLIPFLAIQLFADFKSETTPSVYHDFGVYGKEYKIIEKDILEEINTEVKNYAINSDETEKIIKAQIEERSTGLSKLPLCAKDSQLKPEIDYGIVPEDVYNPVGRKILNKGDKIKSEIKNGQSLDLCFVDARNKIVLSNQINSMIKTNPNCIFLVAGKSVIPIRKDFPDYKIFPTSKMQEDRFGIKCYPAVIHMEKDTKQINYMSYDKFKN